MKTAFGILFSLSALFVVAQGPKRILLTNGTLHVGNGEIVNSAAIGIENGKIKFVKNALATTIKKSEWDTIIDLQSQHVYPGFVAPNSTLGLTEIDAVRATNDYNEVGEYNPHIRALIAFNAESKVIATVRTNGVLLAQATPRGGVISGTSSVMKLAGWNWEDAVAKIDDGIHLNWPSSIQGGGWRSKPSDTKRGEQYEENKRKIKLFFEAAKLYAEKRENQETPELRYAAMKELFTGTKRLYIHANEVQQILDIIDFSRALGIQYPVIVGGYDAYLITERLRDSKIPVMLPRVHSLPQNEDDPVDLPYQLPALLYKGQVKFCLQNEGDMEAMNTRNLPFLAGTAMAHGLPQEEAVRAISLSACEIMGIEKSYGSVEVGKQATLFVSKGSALDVITNSVSLILVDGSFVELDNVQSELYKKYNKKFGL